MKKQIIIFLGIIFFSLVFVQAYGVNNPEIPTLSFCKSKFSFLCLDDTPKSYSGQAGKVVAVNDAENGLEFIMVNGSSSSNVSSVTSSTNCILISPTTGDVVLTFNTSCAGSGSGAVDSVSSVSPYLLISPTTGDVEVNINGTVFNTTITQIASKYNDTTLILSVNSSLWTYILNNQASWNSTFNLTYATFAYNQTTPAINYANANFLNLSGTNANQNINISPYNLTAGDIIPTRDIIFNLNSEIRTSGGYVFRYNPIDTAGLVFNTTTSSFEFLTITLGKALQINAVTGVVNTLSNLNVGGILTTVGGGLIGGNLQVNGNASVLGNSLTVGGFDVCLEDGTNCENKTITKEYQSGNLRCISTGGTTCLMTNDGASHNFGTTASQDAGIYYVGNGTITKYKIRAEITACTGTGATTFSAYQRNSTGSLIKLFSYTDLSVNGTCGLGFVNFFNDSANIQLQNMNNTNPWFMMNMTSGAVATYGSIMMGIEIQENLE